MFAVAVIMPIALGCLHAAAQMVPVESPSRITSPTPPPERTTGTGLTTISGETTSLARVSAPFNPTGGTGAGVQLPPAFNPRHEARIGFFSTAALGLTGSTLGPGIEIAVPVARPFNLRVGGSYFNYRVPFTVDGINYSMALKLTSGQGTIDWYPAHGGFHISVGALYFKNSVGALASVGPGQQFQLGGVTYVNSVDDPVQGTASLMFQRKIAPLVLLGFGNLVPRSGRHISVPFEFGGAYLAPPQVGIQLDGTACTTRGCFNTATDPAAQVNLASEVAKLNHDLQLFQVYPIVSIGLALRF